MVKASKWIEVSHNNSSVQMTKTALWRAVATVRGDSTVFGTITFEQFDESSPTNISWNIRGNDANSLRAFHIHEFGDNTNGCTSAGLHFNPFGRTHGSPSHHERHVGDLGNFQTDSRGTSIGTMTDHLVKLIGPESVIGRTIVIHSGTNDLGQGPNKESQVTGNAGGRPACGVIGISSSGFSNPRPRSPVETAMIVTTSHL
ncbi:Cu/Zn superoxide dismutase [Fusarium oxysporum f. sp. pisi HDV247]|uniref:Superoxide dismutase [Cu-Zn] n=1 Tax=Fusarium oxysporum f. sp. pisi HDV247 TaxID=1080344 RepID=W9NH70_FUSOX|nr:Cu/Zn superoxide dismutase [Fusarium oxysporum f. sp. pisi HDV247]